MKAGSRNTLANFLAGICICFYSFQKENAAGKHYHDARVGPGHRVSLALAASEKAAAQSR